MKPEIHETLINWGAWSRGDMRLTPSGTILGKLVKKVELETQANNYRVTEFADDDYMIFIDRCISKLPAKFIRFCKTYYKAGHSLAETANRMKMSRYKATEWRSNIHSLIERMT